VKITAWIRSRSSSFIRIRLTCVLTVDSSTASAEAISRVREAARDQREHLPLAHGELLDAGQVGNPGYRLLGQAVDDAARDGR
jgi:hypothetical protein